MDKKYTSERVSPEDFKNNLEEYLIYLGHEKTYDFAAAFVKGKVVLDYGCGEGYGSHLLSRHAEKVFSTDIDPEAIRFARKKYTDANLNFSVTQPLEREPLPFADNFFDAVLSFQVIEHVEDVKTYLKEMRRVLKPKGKFILSTPNGRIRLLPFQNPWNKFHLREYRLAELRKVVTEVFPRIELWGLTLDHFWFAREQRRLNRYKWGLWLITHKLIPDRLRRYLLHKVWQTFSYLKTKPTHARDKSAGAWPSLSSVVITDKDVKNCPSFIVVCS